MSTIFQKIFCGEITAQKLWQSQDFCLLLDKYPLSLGHTLLIPAEPFEKWTDLPSPLWQKANLIAQETGQILQEILACERSGLLIHGFGVKDHFHLHIVPMWTGEEIFAREPKPIEQTKIDEFVEKFTKKVSILNKFL